MSAKNRQGPHRTTSEQLRPHIRWANQIIGLARCQLPDAERERVEAHLKICPACQEAYLAYRDVEGLLHEKAPPALPPGLPPKLQALKDRLTAEVAAENARKVQDPPLPAVLEESVGSGRTKRKRLA